MNPNALPATPAAPRRIPSYRRHRPSGQAVATFGRRDFYLGAFGSKASKAEYRRRLAEWLAAGSPTYTAPEPSALTVNDLILRYWKHVKAYYRPETREGTIAPTPRACAIAAPKISRWSAVAAGFGRAAPARSARGRAWTRVGPS